MNCPKCGNPVSQNDKKCRYCGVIISKAMDFKNKNRINATQYQPVHQNINKPQDNNTEGKHLLIAIIIIALLAGGYWFFTSTKINKPEFEVSAREIYKDYSKNELKADLKYKDKIILVSGKVATSFSQFDKPNVLLQTESSIWTVQCRFDKNSPEIANLDKGDPVKIKGRCTGETISNVFFEDCILQ